MHKQCDITEANTQILNTKVAELISQLDTCNSQCAQLSQEKEILQKNLDVVKVEKNALDKNKMELNSMVRLGNTSISPLACLSVKIVAPKSRVVCVTGRSSEKQLRETPKGE